MRRFAGVSMCVVSLAYGVPVHGHHSFAAEFDGSKPVVLRGAVTKVEWQNPHIWFYVDEKDAVNGKTVTWGFSGGPPGMLLRRGITKEVIKQGDTVTVSGFRAKDGSFNASGGKVTFAKDGKEVFTASAEDAVPKD